MNTNKYYIRWMKKAELETIASLEECVYGKKAISLKNLQKICKERNTIGLICEYQSTLIGYCIYKLEKDKVDIIRLVIDPLYTQDGAGSALLDRMKLKIRGDRTKVKIVVEDSNLVSHLFLKSHGFIATSVNHVENDDYYVFEYTGSVPAELA